MRIRTLLTDDSGISGVHLCDGLLREGNGAAISEVDKIHNWAKLASSSDEQRDAVEMS